MKYIKKVLRKVKVKICSMFARYPITYTWPNFWWRRVGYNISKKSYISPYLLIVANHSIDQDLIVIEDFVNIAPNVTLVVSSHPVDDILKYGRLINSTKGKIILKRGSWIGTGAIILPNVTIGEGAIVGAGTVVTKSVEPYTVVAGVPARVIRRLNSLENTI